MNTIRSSILMITLAALAVADDAQSLVARGSAAYDAKDYAAAATHYLAAIEKGAAGATTPYNLACCFALTDRPDDAFRYLNLAIERGWRDADHIESDADFNSLHADPRWKESVASCHAATERYFKSLPQPELARELLRRQALDQKYRRLLAEAFARLKPGETSLKHEDAPEAAAMGNVDAENTEFMKGVIAKHGWPGKSLVGVEAAGAAWLLVQHADHDPEFQTKALEHIKTAFKTGDATGQQLAYLTDRVLLKQGKKQLYGTQFVGMGPDTKPAPIEDEANVDQRRKEVGLPPLADYARTLRSQAP